MKKITLASLTLLAAVSLTACASSQQKTSQASSSSSSKSSASQKSSSSKKTSSSSNSSSSSSYSYQGSGQSFSDRMTMDPDDGAALNDLPDAGSIPELATIRSFHLASGFTIQVNGEDINANQPKTSYDEVAAALGAPITSSGSDDPANAMHFWNTDNGTVMASFSNNVLTHLIFKFKDTEPAKGSYTSITESDTPKTAFEKLGRPEGISRSQRHTTYTYKDSSGQAFAFSTQGQQIVRVTSPSELKQTQDIIDSSMKGQ